MRQHLVAACQLVTLLLVLVLCLAQGAYAQPPAMPCQFYGNITIDGSPASQGATVSARVGGTEIGSTTTDAQGRYGYSPTFKISGNNGATVEFYINGVKANQTYPLSSGAITNLNLTTGTGSTPPPPPPPPPPDSSPSPSGISVSTSIMGHAGTISLSQSGVLENAITLSSADGAVQLSLKANTTLTIQGQSLTVTTEATPPSPPPNTKVVAAYKFSPSESAFKPAIVLSLKYDPTALPAEVTESSLFIAYWDGSSWAAQSSTVDSQAKVVTTQISHFSLFAMLGMAGGAAAPKPASFTISDLKISPTMAEPGEPVTIAAVVTNSGGSQGSYNVVLKVNGVVEAEDEVTLGAGKTEEVTFTVSKEDADTYSVAIDDQSGSFEVSETSPKQGSPLGTTSIIALALAGVLVIVLIIVLTRKRSSR